MKRYWILIFVLILLGCQPIKRGTLLDNLKCVIPCWENITPGATTKSVLSDLLLSSPIVVHSTIKSWVPVRTYDEVVGAEIVIGTSIKSYLFVYLINDRVALISIEGVRDITIADAIEKVGDPQYVVVASYMDDIYVSLINLDKGFTFRYGTGGQTRMAKKGD
ncbi:hypothetical protein FBQ99_15710 [Chloroflexi bacterium CFX2]|nr:hypothetical protein [Chloroflexi bacterium CFX2]